VTWLFILLAMAVVAVVAGVVTGGIVGSMEPPESSLPFHGLPPGRVESSDLAELRFDAALRGYRMDQVDEILDQVTAVLRHRDEEIIALRSELADVYRELGYSEPEVRLESGTGPESDR
jgi:DivIVA domain-containing protein